MEVIINTAVLNCNAPAGQYEGYTISFRDQITGTIIDKQLYLILLISFI